MDERELRAAMDDAVAVTPPPMREEPVLVAGRQALTRRRALRASTWSAAAVAIMAVGATVLAPAQHHDIPIGQPPTTSKPSAPTSSSNGGNSTMATSGPQYDRAVALAAALKTLMAGYGTPDDLMGVGDSANLPLSTHAAMPSRGINGTEMWYYTAITPLTLGEGLGELIVTVYSPGGKTTGEGCGMTPSEWGTFPCTTMNVDGKKVAVTGITDRTEHGLPPVQWAGYRHPDGTVVFVTQSSGMARSGRPALKAMPMTDQELAALTAHPSLKPQ